MNWSELKDAVNAIIKENASGEITGALLQMVLNNVIDTVGKNYSFKGVATFSTVPGTPDEKLFYLASAVGVYSNFDGIEINTPGIYAISYVDGIWTLSVITYFEGLITSNGQIKHIVTCTKEEWDTWEATGTLDDNTVYYVLGAGPSALELLIIELASQLDGKADNTSVAAQIEALTSAINGKANNSDLLAISEKVNTAKIEQNPDWLDIFTRNGPFKFVDDEQGMSRPEGLVVPGAGTQRLYNVITFSATATENVSTALVKDLTDSKIYVLTKDVDNIIEVHQLATSSELGDIEAALDAVLLITENI